MTFPLPTTGTLYRRSGTPGLQTLIPSTSPLPKSLPPTSLLIAIHTISLNYRDANMLHNTNPWPVAATGIPCSDAAGTVLAIGTSVTRFKVGDRVCSICDQRSITGKEQEREWLGGEVDGVLASHVVFEEERVVGVPEGMGWREACLLPVAGVTAWSSLAVGGALRAGLTVLIQGTGGVSLMALKLARAAGYKVILTSSSDAKLEKVRNFSGIGPISTINYVTTPDWDVEAIRLNGGRGVDIVIENGGTSSLMKSVNATAKRGIISQVGYLGEQKAEDLKGLLERLIDRTVTLRGINVGSRLEFEELCQIVSANEIDFSEVIDRTFKFEEAEEAFAYLWSGKHVGKVIIQL